MAQPRTNFYNQHLMKMQSRIIIPKNDLQKGMVISNLYKRNDGSKKQYMFLVLNPLYIGKVHVLSLNEFSVLKFQDLAEETGVRIIPKYKKRGLDIPKLIMEESSQRYYIRTLKRDLKRLYNNSYRTLLFNSMGMVTLIDYGFDREVPEEK